MKVAIVTDSYFPTRDGVVTTVVTTKATLEAMGHEVFIVAPDPGEENRLDGVYYCPAVKFGKYDGYFRPRFKGSKIPIIGELNPDIIHIHGVAVMAVKGLYSGRSFGIPTVLTYITMVNEVVSQYSPVKLPKGTMNLLVGIYLRNLLKRPGAIVVPTPSIAKELSSMNVSARRMEVIPIGVDTKTFVRNGRGQEIREKHSIVGKKVAIVAGRLASEKNIGLVIKSLKQLDDDMVALIVGKGPMDAELRELAKKEGVEDRAIFAGFVPDGDLVAYYSAADIAVSASKFETQGLTTLEAMSCGLPAVCANGRAFTDVITEGVNGYLFECNEDECSEAIRKGFDNVESLSRGARETAERYSIENTAKSLVNLYTELTEPKKRSKIRL